MQRKEKKRIGCAGCEQEFLKRQNIYYHNVENAKSTIDQLKKIINQKNHA